MNIRAFTLIELLVVIAILATLATAVILIINPAELLKNARDSNRLSDLAALNSALSLFQTDQYNLSLGTVSTTYVSVPDTSPTCANLGLPALPSGWTYHCVPSSSSTRVDGTGWIPVNFSLISSGSPLSKLPIDPINTTSTGNYYTYTPGGSWELTMFPEAAKNKMGGANDKTSTDAGSYPDLYETGSNLTLLPVDYGDTSLVGYWKFDEGSGTTAYDSSGHGNNGSGNPVIDWTSSNCESGNCVTAASGYGTIYKISPTFSNVRSNVTIAHWVKINTAIASSSWPYSASGNTHISYGFRSASNGTSWYFEYATDYPTCGGSSFTATTASDIGLGAWHFLAMTYDGATIITYLDGAQFMQRSFSTGFCGIPEFDFAGTPTAPGSFSVDNVRFYSRVLSAAEIQALYKSGQ